MKPSCTRFERLSALRAQELSDRETAFLEAHRLACETCRKREFGTRAALNFLQDAGLDHEGDDAFDRRLATLWSVEKRARRETPVWAPAIASAVMAALAVLAVLQVITHREELEPIDVRGHEARLASPDRPEFPLAR